MDRKGYRGYNQHGRFFSFSLNPIPFISFYQTLLFSLSRFINESTCTRIFTLSLMDFSLALGEFSHLSSTLSAAVPRSLSVRTRKKTYKERKNLKSSILFTSWPQVPVEHCHVDWCRPSRGGPLAKCGRKKEPKKGIARPDRDTQSDVGKCSTNRKTSFFYILLLLPFICFLNSFIFLFSSERMYRSGCGEIRQNPPTVPYRLGDRFNFIQSSR